MSGPIKPTDIVVAKQQFIPEAVFDAFNRLISLSYSHGRATVKQEDVVRILTEGGMKRAELFNDGYLNVEDAYRAQGWDVSYDKPDPGSPGEPVFTFRYTPRENRE